MRDCPYCGEKIEYKISKCPFCGSTVEAEEEKNSIDDNPENIYYFNKTEQNAPILHRQNTLSNGAKVAFVMLSMVPLIGQLTGIILSIIFMNSEKDPDKKSYGKALLIGTLIVTAITFLFFIAYFVLMSLYLQQHPELFEQLMQMQ